MYSIFLFKLLKIPRAGARGLFCEILGLHRLRIQNYFY